MDLKRVVSIIGVDMNDWIKNEAIISEIRIHSGNYITLCTRTENLVTDIFITQERFKQIISEFCGHSMHTYENTIRRGYIDLGDGFRAGVCGKAVTEKSYDGKECVATVNINAISIRIPHKIKNAADELYEKIFDTGKLKSCLIYSPPGVGKTTILRELALKLAGENCGKNAKKLRVALIDSRCEIKNADVEKCPFIDIYSGYPKAEAIEAATRTMSPQAIICDEIGDYDEAEAILSAQNTGVPFIATAHADSVERLIKRRNIRILHENMIFDMYIGLTVIDSKMRFALDIKNYGDV